MRLSNRVFALALCIFWMVGMAHSQFDAFGAANELDRSSTTTGSVPLEPEDSNQTEIDFEFAAIAPIQRPEQVLIFLRCPLQGKVSQSPPAFENSGHFSIQPPVEVSALMQCWQFCWDTASNPRSPSLVS